MAVEHGAGGIVDRGPPVNHETSALQCASERAFGVAAEANEMTVQIEKTRFNLWHLGGIVLAMIMNAATAGGIWVSLTRDVSDLQKQVSETSDTLHQFQADLNATKTLLPPIQFKQEQQELVGAENKASIGETNKRIDRVVESFGGKLDTVIESINKIATRVEVLGSKLDDANKTDKTVYRTPIVRP